MLFFMECERPNKKLMVEHSFLDFLCWCDAGFVGGRKEGVC